MKNPGEIKMGKQLARHLTGLRAAANRLGFSSQVTGALSRAAEQAEIEARQAACQHASKEPTSLNCARIRAAVTVCLDCRKSLLVETV